LLNLAGLKFQAVGGTLSVKSGQDLSTSSVDVLSISGSDINWSSGSLFRSESKTDTKLTAGTITQSALQSRYDAASLSISATSNTGSAKLLATGTDAALNVRALGALTWTAQGTFQSFTSNVIQVESYADGLISLKSANQIKYTTSVGANQLIRESAKQTILTGAGAPGVTLSGGATTMTGNKITSTSTTDTSVTASAGTLSIVGGDVSFVSGGAGTIGSITAPVLTMSGNPITWTSSATADVIATASITLSSGGLSTYTASGAGTTNNIKSTAGATSVTAGRTVDMRTTGATSIATGIAGNTNPVTVTSTDGFVDISAGSTLTLNSVSTAGVTQGIVAISVSGDVLGSAVGGMSILSNAVDSGDASGIRLRTTDVDGDIVLQSYLGASSTTAANGVTVSSNDYARIRATGAVSLVSATGFTATSNVGALEMHGSGGFDIRGGVTADNSVDLTSTGAQLFQAEDAITIAANANTGTLPKDVTFTSVAGVVRFGTANDKSISGTTQTDIVFNAAKQFSLGADSALTLSSLTGFTATAATDVFMTTLGGVIDINSVDGKMTMTSNTGNSTFSSGGDLSATAATNNVQVTAGTIFAATALAGDGRISSTSGSAFFKSATSSVLITADGERNLPRDGVTLSSATSIVIKSTDAASAINFNAENLFAVGREQRPRVEFWGAGSASQLGWTLNSGGNVDITTSSTLGFTAGTVQTTTARNYLELSSDTSVAITAVGAAAQPLHNVDIKATIGSVFVRSAGAISTKATNRLTATSTAHGITVSSNSVNSGSGVTFQATTGMLEFNSQQLDVDTLAMTGSISNLALWRASNGIVLNTNAGDGGVVSFVSTGSITSSADGGMTLRTLSANADVSIDALGGTSIQLLTSGSSGSPVVLASGSSTTVSGSIATLSGTTGIYVQADDTSGNDLAGDITITATTLQATATKHADIIGGNQVLLTTRQPPAGAAAPITIAASRNVRLSSNDDSTFTAQSHAFSTTIGGVDISTTQDGLGDVRFASDKAQTWNIFNDEALWETHNNFFGQMLGAIQFTSRGDRDSIGLLLSSNGNKAETVLRSEQGSVIGIAADALSIRSGSTPDNAIYNVSMHSNTGGDVVVATSTLVHTTSNTGDIVIKADAAEVKYSFNTLAVSAGIDLSFNSAGSQSESTQNSVYGIRSFSTTTTTISANNGTVSMHAAQAISSRLSGKLGFSATTPVGTAKLGGGSGISFDSTGAAATLRALSLGAATLSSSRDVTVQANSAGGGIVSVYSSGPAKFAATLNMDFSNLGGVGSILVATSSNLAYGSPIQISAPENFALSSNLRSRFSAEDPSGANIRVRSQNDQINIEQYGLSANGLGIELRANDGSITAQAQGDGSVVMSAVQGLAARAVNAVNLQSSGGAGAIKINGGQLAVRSARGGVSLVSGTDFTFKASADIDVQSNGLVASDIEIVATTSTAVTVDNGPLTFASNWGDVRFESQEGSTITLEAPTVAVDASGHFTIPFENRDVPLTCTVNGQIARFTTTGIQPSILGLAPQRPNPTALTDYNKGRLCVCFNNTWRCTRF
jgi:hypothetical protein